MARWQPDAARRLQTAALELFATRGYEHTSAAEIAASVGLTERTFYRYFRDKPEVLFRGGEQFVAAFVAGLDDASPDLPAMLVIAAAVEASGSFFPAEGREFSRRRRAVIAGDPSLRERERQKLAELAASLAEALRARGFGDPAATLAAESGVTVFNLAFAQWVGERETRSLSEIARELLQELSSLTAPLDGRVAH